MFDQTPMNRIKNIDAYRAARPRDLDVDGAGVRRLLADATELVELQARLLASDLKCLAESAVRPFIFAAISCILALGALPVLFLSGASFLIDQFDWSPALAQFAISGGGILAALVFVALAAMGLKKCGSPLSRSQAEFDKNMDTLREMLGGQDALSSHLEELERRDRQ